MESIRSFCYIRGKSSLFVLANTLSVVPFLLFFTTEYGAFIFISVAVFLFL